MMISFTRYAGRQKSEAGRQRSEYQTSEVRG